MAQKPSTRDLVNQDMRGQLNRRLREWDAAKMSSVDITYRIHELTGRRVASQTVRNWLAKVRVDASPPTP